MSKPVKNLIVNAYREQFEGETGGVVICLRGIGANGNNMLRGALAEKQMHVMIVKNSLARRAWVDTPLEPLGGILDGPSALVWGGESVVDVARALVEEAKSHEAVEFRGALMDGQVFAADEVEKLSKFPTREEAQAEALQLVLSPGQNTLAAAMGPGRNVASLVKAIEEKLEKGETIEKAA